MKYLVLLLVLAGCGAYTKIVGPKFKVGDCITYDESDDSEFIKPEVNLRKILQVGKRNYLYMYDFGAINESPISRLDNIMIKIACPTE